MIKRAHQEFGAPSEPFPRTLLPPPTEEAVREECKAGVVRQARARQELRTQAFSGPGATSSANLDDLSRFEGPSLNNVRKRPDWSKVDGCNIGWLAISSP